MTKTQRKMFSPIAQKTTINLKQCKKMYIHVENTGK